MQYPASPFMVLYNAYRIVRQGDPDGDGSSRGALYYIQRPDGSECCRDVTWARAERVIRRDMEAKGWPSDGLPAKAPAEVAQTERLIPPTTPVHGTKPRRARAR
jgi:hypothetical protein